MAQRKIVWTRKSEIQLQQLLEFFIERNKNVQYSRKLYNKFTKELRTVAKNPEIGIKTKFPNIRGLVIDDYILFYEITEDKILILKVWDCRQNPEKLDIER